METLEWDGPKAAMTIGNIAMKKYIEKIIDKKLELNEKFKDDSEMNETHDSIMVTLKKKKILS
jgi:hypothetical protein